MHSVPTPKRALNVLYLGQEDTYCIYGCLRGNDTQGNFLRQCKSRLFAPDNKNMPEKEGCTCTFVGSPFALYCGVLKTCVIIVGRLLLVKLPCASGSADFSDSV